MSLEIRELVIKASVVGKKSAEGSGKISQDQLKKLKKQIINECIESVLDKLEERMQR